MPIDRKIKNVMVCLLAVLILLIFRGILDNTFIIYDDPEYITENVHIRDGITWQSLQWAFTSYENANWHPLTWISHMLDIELYSFNPAGHHFTSLLIHTANTVLLLVVLHRMSGAFWQSLATAVLFGVHPLHVESVAWISERKDVLSTFFFMLTLWAYERHAGKPGIGRYWMVILLFAFSLMSKPMLVTLPLVLLLLDFWPLKRIACSTPPEEACPQQFGLSGLLYEKIPLVMLSVISSIVTYLGQLRGGSTPLPDKASHADNIANGLFSYAKYIEKLLWPQGLAVFYPRNNVETFPLLLASTVIILLSITAIVARKKYPYAFVGWFWFVCTLVPVIGFIRIGSSAMADRYTYVPAIGFFILVCWSVGTIISTHGYKARLMAIIISITVISSLSVLTVRQIRHWNNSFTLFEHALKVTERNWLAYNNLASAYIIWATNNRTINLTNYLCSKQGCDQNVYTRFNCLNRAIDASSAAIQINPVYPSAYFNLGLAYAERGDRQHAITIEEKLENLNPALAERLNSRLADRN